MKRSLLIFACTLLALINIAKAQQDAQFSQYMFNGIYINPAYAGYREELNVHAFYRNQWTGIDGAPKTMSMAIDAIANDGNVGLALQVTSDRLGAQRNNSIYGNYSYRLQVNTEGTSRLAFGLGVGAIQLGIDGAMFAPNDPEREQPTNYQTTIVPDARAGVYFATDRFFAGLSADNLISQYIDVSRYAFIPQPRPHYYLTAGLLLPLSTDILVKPSFLIKEDRGGPTSLDLNAFFILGDRLWLGGSYRTSFNLYDKSYLQKDLVKVNSAVAAIQVFPTKTLRIGYAYDFSIGPLQGFSAGSHEISLGFFFNKKNIRMLTPRYF